MNDQPSYSKKCYKCDTVVRMAADEFALTPTWWTTCDRCRAIVTTEARFVGTPINQEGSSGS